MTDKFENNYTELIFEDQNSLVFHAANVLGVDMINKGPATIKLYIDRVEIEYANIKNPDILNFDDLKAINAQIHEKLEILYKDDAYRIEGGRPGVSALKWEVAVNAVWRKLGQNHKLSPYIIPKY